MATLIYPELVATTEDNLVEGTASNDLIMVMGNMVTDQNRSNLIIAGDGDDNIVINGALVSRNATWQTGNEIQVGDGNNVIFIGQGIDASDNGYNRIEFSGSAGMSSELIVNDLLSAVSGGVNQVSFQEGEHATVETKGWHANDNGRNEIEIAGKGGITIDGDMTAEGRGSNDITLGSYSNVSTEDSFVHVNGNLIANGGYNFFFAYSQGEYVIAGSLLATDGSNDLSYGQSNLEPFSIHIGQDVIATDNGQNSIEINSSLGELTIGGVMAATNDGYNRILLTPTENGAAYLEINGGLLSEQGENRIELKPHGEFSQAELQVHISGHLQGVNQNGNALVADNGINTISIGTYNGQSTSSTLNINGGIDAANGGANHINAGDSADQVILNGKVTAGALDIDLGDGYDVLALQSASHFTFAGNYQDWLTTTTLADMGIEAMQVGLGRPTTSALNSLDWLDQIISDHNDVSENDIELRLDIDRAGNISLDDLFSSARSDTFSGLNMAGQFSNTLTIDGSLADNGMDGSFLRVLGDNRDSVSLTEDWSLAQSNYIDETGLSYDRYTNASDELLIQSTISIV